MRIISGELKGKKLLIPEDKNTRPLRDMVKESIFNILQHSNKFDFNLENNLKNEKNYYYFSVSINFTPIVHKY